jgi:hypothetical protein
MYGLKPVPFKLTHYRALTAEEWRGRPVLDYLWCPGEIAMRTILLTVLAGVVALVLDLLIAAVALRCTQVPRGFAPFTFLPIMSGAFGGALLASMVYAVIRMTSQQPERMFLFVAMGMLALSFALPLRLSFTKLPRFAGVTPSAQMVLVLMHAVVATVCVVCLLAKPSR